VQPKPATLSGRRDRAALFSRFMQLENEALQNVRKAHDEEESAWKRQYQEEMNRIERDEDLVKAREEAMMRNRAPQAESGPGNAPMHLQP